MTAAALAPSRLHPGDLLRVGSIGLRTRRLRASLSALGIAIGIAAMVAVLGISASSKADLLSVLDKLGTNHLTVQATSGIGAGDAELPSTAVSMLRRIEPVQAVSAVTSVDAKVYRNDKIPSGDSAGLSVKAAEPHLLETIGGTVASGRFLDEESSKLPTVVLGSVAAERLGVTGPGVRVWLGDHWYQVIGVLDPIDLAKDIDRAALIGEANAKETFDIGDSPETIYLQVAPDDVEAVQSVIPATVNPANPDQVEVSRPSDAIEARAAASNAFTSLFLGLGAVALLVGGVGIANVMVISVLERRSEIGLRRALGATKRHVSIQFLAEALLLSAIGGTCGVILGAGVTIINAAARGWTPVIPATAMVGGVGAALLIGAVAGLYPAVRAARLSPTEALRTI